MVRRGVCFALGILVVSGGRLLARQRRIRRTRITDFGAVGDDATLNTPAIQATIDHIAVHGGGTVVVPPGVFISGALFFRPGVDLHLMRGAVLKCSTKMENFPPQRTRIEGHFEDHFTPALINARACDGFRISGSGTLDGDGRGIWDLFWKMRNAAPDPQNFPNLSLPRARLALIEGSANVEVCGVTFRNAQFWNLHLYKCCNIRVLDAKFEVPDDYRQAPSTDGIDLDSCRNVRIEGCDFSVTDDCIAAKGSKGPDAMADTASPPVEHIRVHGCTFRRGHGVLTLGSEATIVRDVVVSDCRVTGPVNVAVLKLRPDTPQIYVNITYRNLRLDAEAGALISVKPWTQYFDLKGEAPPLSCVSHLRFEGITGRFGSFGIIHPNPGQTEIRNILMKDCDLTLTDGKLNALGVTNMTFRNVRVNGMLIKH